MTVGELLMELYKLNPNLPIVLPAKQFYAGSEYTGTIVVNTEETIDRVLDFETKIVLTIKNSDISSIIKES